MSRREWDLVPAIPMQEPRRRDLFAGSALRSASVAMDDYQMQTPLWHSLSFEHVEFEGEEDERQIA